MQSFASDSCFKWSQCRCIRLCFLLRMVSWWWFRWKRWYQLQTIIQQLVERQVQDSEIPLKRLSLWLLRGPREFSIRRVESISRRQLQRLDWHIKIYFKLHCTHTRHNRSSIHHEEIAKGSALSNAYWTVRLWKDIDYQGSAGQPGGAWWRWWRVPAINH